MIDHFNAVSYVTRRLKELQPRGLALSVISQAELWGNISLIVRELIKNNWPCTTATVSQAMLDIWSQLSDDPSWLAAKRVSDTRLRQIAELTGNGQHGFSLVRNGQRLDFQANGQRKDYGRGMASQSSRALRGAWSASESKSLDEMTDDEVAAIYSEYAQTMAFKAMSKEQLREYIKGNRPENNGATLQLPHVVETRPCGLKYSYLC